MVTRAGKDLLKNTIRSTDYHNKLLQEDGMWKQWEIEKGLTMMVTDDCIRNRMRMDSYSGKKMVNMKSKSVHTRQLQKHKEAARESRSKGNYWSRKLMEAEDNDPDRWGHSGYRELYPEDFRANSPSSSRSRSSLNNEDSDRSKKRSHKKHKHKHKQMKKSKRKKTKSNSSDEERRSSKSDKVNGSLRNNKKERRERTSETGEISQTSDISESEHRSDINNFPKQNLSLISTSALARRREYLERKLQEFSQESSSESSLEDEAETKKIPEKRRKRSKKQSHSSTKLRSQVIIEVKNKKAKH